MNSSCFTPHVCNLIALILELSSHLGILPASPHFQDARRAPGLVSGCLRRGRRCRSLVLMAEVSNNHAVRLIPSSLLPGQSLACRLQRPLVTLR